MPQMGNLEDLVRVIDERDVDPEQRIRRGTLSRVLQEILFHSSFRFWHFTPTHSGAPPFEERLEAWLANPGIIDGDIETLLRTVPQIQFVDRDDLLTLYRAAHTGAIQRWLMDELVIDFSLDTDELRQKLAAALDETWFCPVTDSMNIAEFVHINNISGQAFRPSWRTLKKFADLSKIRDFMSVNSLKRIVLLEDFVGSGTQSTSVVRFAVSNFCPSIPVLFVPLIISEFGLQHLMDKVGSPSGFRVEPILKIPAHIHVRQDPHALEVELIPKLRDLTQRTFETVRQPFPPEKRPLEEPFGFGSVGTLVVLYTNAPNNTLPLVWHRAPNWRPLFPRVSRQD